MHAYDIAFNLRGFTRKRDSLRLNNLWLFEIIWRTHTRATLDSINGVLHKMHTSLVEHSNSCRNNWIMQPFEKFRYSIRTCMQVFKRQSNINPKLNCLSFSRKINLKLDCPSFSRTMNSKLNCPSFSRKINLKLNCLSFSRKSSPGNDLRHGALMASWNIIFLEWKCLRTFKLKLCIMYQREWMNEWIETGDLNRKQNQSLGLIFK